MVKVRNFNLSDVPAASALSYSIWSGELAGLKEDDKLKIYEFLVRHSLYDLEYSFVAEKEGELLAFLLADGTHSAKPGREYDDPSDPAMNEALRTYKEYLDHNREHCLPYLDDKTAYLALFASIKKGCGALLLDALIDKCHEDGKNRLCLWTDTTCDHTYYEKHGYDKVLTYEGKPLSGGLKPDSFVYLRTL